MCRVQADGDTIGDVTDAQDADGLSDAPGVIAAEEEAAPAEEAPVEADADEAVVETPAEKAAADAQAEEAADESDEEASDEETVIAPNVVLQHPLQLPQPRPPAAPPPVHVAPILPDAGHEAQMHMMFDDTRPRGDTVESCFWSAQVNHDTHQCMEGIIASAWEDQDAACDVDIESVHSDIAEDKDGLGHISVMIQVFV